MEKRVIKGMHKKGIFIETKRIFIREIRTEDDIGMFELDSDEEVHKYLGNKPFKIIDESRSLIEFIKQQYFDYGIGRWALVDNATGEFIGWTGFKWMKETINHHTDYYDFGYRLKRKFWGRGYATESAIAAMNYGMETLKLKEIYAMTDVNNMASRRVLEKIGMEFIETFNYDGDPTWRTRGEPTTWYKSKNNN